MYLKGVVFRSLVPKNKAITVFRQILLQLYKSLD